MSEWTINDPKEKIVFTVIDPTGVMVYLYKEQWDHIKNRHREIKPLNKVQSAVKNPDIIQSEEESNARIYSVRSSTKSYLNVFAGIISETECKIRTAFIRDLPEGDCIWLRQKK